MSRLICYCFEFTKEQMQTEVRDTGRSRIPEIIADRCKRGLHDCEVKNPAGRCCLGDVRKTLKCMISATDVESASEVCDPCEKGVGKDD